MRFWSFLSLTFIFLSITYKKEPPKFKTGFFLVYTYCHFRERERALSLKREKRYGNLQKKVRCAWCLCGTLRWTKRIPLCSEWKSPRDFGVIARFDRIVRCRYLSKSIPWNLALIITVRPQIFRFHLSWRIVLIQMPDVALSVYSV